MPHSRLPPLLVPRVLTLAARSLADKPINGSGHKEEALNAAKAVEVIKETNEFYSNLMAGKTDAGKLWLK